MMLRVRTPTLLVTCLVCAVVLTGCEAARPDEPTASTSGTSAAAPAQQWTMPDLVGSILQDAQDEIQSLTGGEVTISTSHDATGQNRTQVMDRNWKVCTQSVAAGDPITPDTLIDFGAVKLEESCP